MKRTDGQREAKYCMAKILDGAVFDDQFISSEVASM